MINGLLQTGDYARAVFTMQRPMLGEKTIKQRVTARLARQELITRQPSPIMSFVTEEAVLRRPCGGTPVMRAQLEHLLHIGRMQNVDRQVMPTGLEEHAGAGGPFALLEPKGRQMMAYVEAQDISRLLTDRKAVRTLEQRYARNHPFGPPWATGAAVLTSGARRFGFDPRPRDGGPRPRLDRDLRRRRGGQPHTRHRP